MPCISPFTALSCPSGALLVVPLWFPYGYCLRAYTSPLANNTEYCIVGIVCTVLLVIYAKERYLMKEIMKEFDEAG